MSKRTSEIGKPFGWSISDDQSSAGVQHLPALSSTVTGTMSLRIKDTDSAIRSSGEAWRPTWNDRHPELLNSFEKDSCQIIDCGAC